MIFDWDKKKAKINILKHKVSFEEAETIFYDFFSVTITDPIHSIGEERFITIGLSNKRRLLIVSHIESENRIWIISSRIATNKERKIYEEENRN